MEERTRSPREPREQIPTGQTDTGKGNAEEKGRSNDKTDVTQLLLGLGPPQPLTPTGIVDVVTPDCMLTPEWAAMHTYSGTRASDTASSTGNAGSSTDKVAKTDTVANTDKVANTDTVASTKKQR